MKKLIMLFIATVACLVFAQRGPFMHHRPTMPPLMHQHHPHHHNGFWTGVGVGLAGSLLLPPVPPPPPVVGPVVYAASPRVWVPPVYGERPIYRAGIYVGTERYIITPGYWR